MRKIDEAKSLDLRWGNQSEAAELVIVFNDHDNLILVLRDSQVQHLARRFVERAIPIRMSD